MNGQTSLAPAALILEVASGDPDWSAHFLAGFQQWLIEGVSRRVDPTSLPAHRPMVRHADVATAPRGVARYIVARWWFIVEASTDRLGLAHKRERHTPSAKCETTCISSTKCRCRASTH